MVTGFFSSFSNRDKSEELVEHCMISYVESEAKREKLRHLFYNMIHSGVNKKTNKYANRTIFRKFTKPSKLLEHLPEMKLKIEKIDGVTVEEVCELFRKVCLHFYRNHMIEHILTFKRIPVIVKGIHLKKKRNVIC